MYACLCIIKLIVDSGTAYIYIIIIFLDIVNIKCILKIDNGYYLKKYADFDKSLFTPIPLWRSCPSSSCAVLHFISADFLLKYVKKIIWIKQMFSGKNWIMPSCFTIYDENKANILKIAF